MSGRGRPRTPVDAKLLAGTHRPYRDGPAGEAVRPGGEPEMPGHLSGEAAALWDAVVPRLVACRVATAVDASVLAAMCEFWAHYRRLRTALAKLPDDDVGSKLEYRLTILAGTAYKSFASIAATFGLNPSDRAKLRIDFEPPPDPGVPPRRRDGGPGNSPPSCWDDDEPTTPPWEDDDEAAPPPASPLVTGRYPHPGYPGWDSPTPPAGIQAQTRNASAAGEEVTKDASDDAGPVEPPGGRPIPVPPRRR